MPGLAQVARRTTGPLAQEFFRVLQEMQIGTGRIQAMRALAERTDVPELKSFVGAMIQADAFGIPISGERQTGCRSPRGERSGCCARPTSRRWRPATWRW